MFPAKALPFLRDMISYVNAIQPESFTRDLLGSIFQELIPPKLRKTVAAYYTNPEAARLLARLCIDDPSASVADLACGSGTLLMAAYDRKADLQGSDVTEKEHQKLLEQHLTGVDIMPFAAHLAVVQLALRQPIFYTNKLGVAVQDSTKLRPGKVISPLDTSMPQGQAKLHIFANEEIEKHRVATGAVSGQGRGHAFTLKRVDVTLMNPPFTRKQLIGKDYRILLSSRLQDYKAYESRNRTCSHTSFSSLTDS